jgi:hypothetical protein
LRSNSAYTNKKLEYTHNMLINNIIYYIICFVIGCLTGKFIKNKYYAYTIAPIVSVILGMILQHFGLIGYGFLK